MTRFVTVAIDGPAASGKGTIARALADAYQLRHLDTGLLYRAVGVKATASGGDLADADAMATLARGLQDADLQRSDLRGEAAAKAASVVAAHPSVRAALLDYQRAFASEEASRGVDHRGAVLDGRDIGTVVLPNADVKLFVSASVEKRAERRFAELSRRGDALTLDAVRADILVRDERDRARVVSPLEKAADADLIDTTELDIERSIALARSIAERCF